MCLCLFAINESEEFPFILLANRDEFRARPAAPAAFWEDHPNVLAGRDLEGMGTWLGITRTGRIAFLTNYRHPDYFNRKGPTRGKLVSNYLTSETSAEDYLRSIEDPKAYNGFNLVVGDAKQLLYYANAEDRIRPITKGIHGLSNAFLNTSWPKVDDGKRKLQQSIETNALSSDHLFSILQDSSLADDSELPNTGVSYDLEKLLSAKFINTLRYGTVCSTVIKINGDRQCSFEERTFDSEGKYTRSAKYLLDLSR